MYLEAYVNRVQTALVEGDEMQVDDEVVSQAVPEMPKMEFVPVPEAQEEGHGLAILNHNSPVKLLKERLNVLKCAAWEQRHSYRSACTRRNFFPLKNRESKTSWIAGICIQS